jgi:hypothetical protein
LQRNIQSEESDFYPYRYLASEGFLPGYNFPALPVRAGSRGEKGSLSPGPGAWQFVSLARETSSIMKGPSGSVWVSRRPRRA